MTRRFKALIFWAAILNIVLCLFLGSNRFTELFAWVVVLCYWAKDWR